MSAADERTTWPDQNGYAAPPAPAQRLMDPGGPIYRPADRDDPPAPPHESPAFAPPAPRGPVDAARPPWAQPAGSLAPPTPRRPVDAPDAPLWTAPEPAGGLAAPPWARPEPQPAPYRPFVPPAQRSGFDPGSPFGPGVGPQPPAHPREPRPPRRWGVGVAIGLIVLLGGAVAYQAVVIDRLDGRVSANKQALEDAQTRDAGRLDGLDGRATELEKRVGAAFNPEAISSAALPSVFRVAAGNVTGTAFAVGKPAGGKINMITNFHVVEGVYNGGGRQVFLERDGKRYPATIVAVNKTGDVAHLRTTTKINGLAIGKDAVKSGQQIVVVGAPLGLSDSVTTGVVSAIRELPDSNGPMIQFDAPINPGNSGGPVINSAKQVVGIATAKAQNAEGIGLAVPIKVACDSFKIC